MPEGLLLYTTEGDPDTFELPTIEGVSQILAQPNLPRLFEMRGRCLSVETVVGWDTWLHSSIYNDYFRQMNSARQFVLGLAAPSGEPRAFMAVCRGETDPPFTVEEERTIVGLRDAAEQALVAFEVSADWGRPTEAILDAVTEALPVPAMLVRQGAIVWMNREAELRLELVSLSFGMGRTFFAGRCAALHELMRHVERELASPGALLGKREASGYSWLLRGEQIVVRRVEVGGCTEHALVCLMTPTLPTAHVPILRSTAHGLTRREAEIVNFAVQGYSMLSIACQLNIAESTVATHLKRVYRKLGVRSRAELAWRVAGGR
jgi:DNA-binding CsgD family transcriptional regulator